MKERKVKGRKFFLVVSLSNHEGAQPAVPEGIDVGFAA